MYQLARYLANMNKEVLKEHFLSINEFCPAQVSTDSLLLYYIINNNNEMISTNHALRLLSFLVLSVQL